MAERRSILAGLELEAGIGDGAEAGVMAGVGVERRPAPGSEHTRAEERPRSFETLASAAFPAVGNLLLIPNPASPIHGYRWHVHSITLVAGNGPIQGLGDTAQAFIYVGTPKGNDWAGSDIAANFADNSPATAGPQVGSYGDWELVVEEHQQLYFIVTGGTIARVYTAAASGKEEPAPSTVHREDPESDFRPQMFRGLHHQG